LISTALPHRDSNRGLFLYFFGEDSKKRMQLKSFDDFLKGLHDEIVRLEFAHYDFKNQVSKLLELTNPSVLMISMSVPVMPCSVKSMLLSVPVMLLMLFSVPGMIFPVPMMNFCPSGDIFCPRDVPRMMISVPVTWMHHKRGLILCIAQLTSSTVNSSNAHKSHANRAKPCLHCVSQ